MSPKWNTIILKVATLWYLVMASLVNITMLLVGNFNYTGDKYNNNGDKYNYTGDKYNYTGDKYNYTGDK